MEIRKELVPPSQRKPKPRDESKLSFGKIPSDHMFCLDYKRGMGWHDARIVPYGPLSLDPAAMVLHYGQEVFEGLKAYRGAGGGIYMFRPKDNMARMVVSCARVCIPEPPADFIMEAMAELVRVERDWVPSLPGTSLYVRPNIIATEAMLGVKVSDEYLFYIITGPVGAYYAEGMNPVKIHVEEKYIRSAPGGLGAAKTSANYVASLLAAEKAHERGYTQVLWLDACDKETIEEVGTMNMLFVIDDEVITAPLDGNILPGITRDSVLKLVRSWGMKVNERRLSIHEVIAAQKNGRLKEAFGSGTAAVISPVGHFAYRGQEYQVADGRTGTISQRLYDEITGIQLGTRPDPFGWVVKIA